MKVEFVMPLAAKGHPPTSVVVAGCGAPVPPLIVAQPGPSPGAVVVTRTVIGYVVPAMVTEPVPVPPAFVAPTANALEFNTASGLRQFRRVNDGFNVQKRKGCRRPPSCPPTANESCTLPPTPRVFV